jgi:hypothetical protein
MEDENPRHPKVMDLLSNNGPIIEEKIMKRDRGRAPDFGERKGDRLRRQKRSQNYEAEKAPETGGRKDTRYRS